MVYRSNLLMNSRASKTSDEKHVYISKEIEKYNKYYTPNSEEYSSNELNLLKDLQKDLINTTGYVLTYIVRTQNTVDKIYGESIGTTFKHSFKIKGNLEDQGNLFEDNPQLLDYGFVNPMSVNVFLPIDILDKEIQKQSIKDRTVPLPGDLIRIDTANMLFEIKNVVWNYSKWNKGENTLYKLVCTLFNLGDEKFDTTDKELNKLNDFNTLFETETRDNEAFTKEASDWKLDFSGE